MGKKKGKQPDAEVESMPEDASAAVDEGGGRGGEGMVAEVEGSSADQSGTTEPDSSGEGPMSMVVKGNKNTRQISVAYCPGGRVPLRLLRG